MRKKRKAKIEFSKKWLIGCIVISLFFTLFSYILAIFDKNTVENLSISIIEMLWGSSGISFIGYVLQNSVRAFSANKFGIHLKEEPLKSEMAGEINND